MSRAAPQFCSLSAANLQQFGFNTSIRRTAALSSPAPSIPTPYFYVRSACDGLHMMAMRPLHRAGADTGCGALRCPAVARDPHGRLHRPRGLSDSALCNPPIAALQLGALGEMLVKQRTLVATIFCPSETKRRLSSLHM